MNEARRIGAEVHTRADAAGAGRYLMFDVVQTFTAAPLAPVLTLTKRVRRIARDEAAVTSFDDRCHGEAFRSVNYLSTTIVVFPEDHNFSCSRLTRSRLQPKL